MNPVPVFPFPRTTATEGSTLATISAEVSGAAGVEAGAGGGEAGEGSGLDVGSEEEDAAAASSDFGILTDGKPDGGSTGVSAEPPQPASVAASRASTNRPAFHGCKDSIRTGDGLPIGEGLHHPGPGCDVEPSS